jgi:hypothetical protein
VEHLNDIAIVRAYLENLRIDDPEGFKLLVGENAGTGMITDTMVSRAAITLAAKAVTVKDCSTGGTRTLIPTKLHEEVDFAA